MTGDHTKRWQVKANLGTVGLVGRRVWLGRPIVPSSRPIIHKVPVLMGADWRSTLDGPEWRRVVFPRARQPIIITI